MRKKFEMDFLVSITCDTDMPENINPANDEFWDNVDDLQEKLGNEIRDLLKKGGFNWNLSVDPDGWGEIK